MGIREDALSAWTAGMRAVGGETSVRRAARSRPELLPDSRTLIVAAGKAAPAMLRGLASAQPPRAGEAARPPIVLVPASAGVAGLAAGTVVLRGGHPYPSAEGRAATMRILAEVDRLGPADRLLVLLSGGASALLEAPAPGVRFDDLADTYRTLVTSGLPIASINLVRGCLSAVKAGQLAARAYPARTTTIAISDVEQDDPAVIGSGPTVPAAYPLPERCRQSLEVLAAAQVELPPRVLQFLRRNAESAALASGAAGPPEFVLVASVADAMAAARQELAQRGYRVDQDAAVRLGGDTTDAAARIGTEIERLARAAASGRPHAIVFGGETTVAVPPQCPGRGGRNLDLACRLALALEGTRDIVVVCAGTDGCDGSSRAAGAVVDGSTAARAAGAGLPLVEGLARFDTEPALEAAGALVVTGETGTNVGDLVVCVAAACAA